MLRVIVMRHVPVETRKEKTSAIRVGVPPRGVGSERSLRVIECVSDSCCRVLSVRTGWRRALYSETGSYRLIDGHGNRTRRRVGSIASVHCECLGFHTNSRISMLWVELSKFIRRHVAYMSQAAAIPLPRTSRYPTDKNCATSACRTWRSTSATSKV